MVAETTEEGISILGDVDVNWQVQIGPNIEGPLEGVINSGQGSFYVATQSPLTIVFAQISLNNGTNWYQMPNNVWVSASGSADIQYVINPQGTPLKFLIALD